MSVAVYRHPYGWRVRIRHPHLPKGRLDKVLHNPPHTKRDAQQWGASELAKLAAAPKLRNRVAPGFSTFCVETYTPYAKKELAASTWARRVYQIATFVEFFGDERLDRIAARWRAYVAHRRADGIRASTINDEAKVMAAILNYARSPECSYPVPEPHLPLERVPARSSRCKAWTADEIARLFTALHELSPNLVPLVTFIANTGARKSEPLRLRWEAVDLPERTAHIEPTEGDDEAEAWEGKTGKTRAVPLNSEVRRVLERLRAENLRRPEGERSAYVFVAPRTGRPYATWPQNQFDRARKAAGLVGGPHTLRHTFASHFLQARPDLFALARILGHSHSRTTELYSHFLPGRMAELAEVVSFSPEGITPPTTDGDA